LSSRHARAFSASFPPTSPAASKVIFILSSTGLGVDVKVGQLWPTRDNIPVDPDEEAAMLDDVGVKRSRGDSEPGERWAPMHAERPRRKGAAALD
jgi:hypothetical protein